jgi:hypothetical protein
LKIDDIIYGFEVMSQEMVIQRLSILRKRMRKGVLNRPNVSPGPGS